MNFSAKVSTYLQSGNVHPCLESMLQWDTEGMTWLLLGHLILVFKAEKSTFILIYFLAFLAPVTASPAPANGQTIQSSNPPHRQWPAPCAAGEWALCTPWGGGKGGAKKLSVCSWRGSQNFKRISEMLLTFFFQYGPGPPPTWLMVDP